MVSTVYLMYHRWSRVRNSIEQQRLHARFDQAGGSTAPGSPSTSEKGFAIQKVPPLQIPDDPRSYIIPRAQREKIGRRPGIARSRSSRAGLTIPDSRPLLLTSISPADLRFF